MIQSYVLLLTSELDVAVRPALNANVRPIYNDALSLDALFLLASKT